MAKCLVNLSVIGLVLLGWIGQAQAADKPSLVLLPVVGPQLNADERNVYQSALVQGLYGRYRVYSGPEVQKKLVKYSQKICDTTQCLQQIAIDFQTELIGRGYIVPKETGFLLTLEIKNIYTDELVETRSEPCSNCSSFDVIAALKTMGGGNDLVAKVEDGKLRIEAEPANVQGDVYIDNQFRGRSPLTVQLEPGLYNVELRSGERVGRTTVQVRPGRSVLTQVRLPEVVQAKEEGSSWWWWVLGGLAVAGAAGGGGGEEGPGGTGGSVGTVEATW